MGRCGWAGVWADLLGRRVWSGKGAGVSGEVWMGGWSGEGAGVNGDVWMGGWSGEGAGVSGEVWMGGCVGRTCCSVMSALLSARIRGVFSMFNSVRICCTDHA